MHAMNDTPPQERERNERTYQAHRREAFWQITFPLIIGLLLALTMAVLAVLSATGTGPVRQAADAALMCLIAPMLFAALLTMLVVGALAYGMIQANKALPFYTKQLQDIFELMRAQVNIGSEKAVEPFLRIHSFLASLGAFKRK